MKTSDTQPHKHKPRRLCQVEGCPRIVKSQGRCQRHGAKPKLCKIPNCSKQAQGNFDGMCKSHFHENQRAKHPHIMNPEELAVSSTHTLKTAKPSVYDTVLPASICWTADSGSAMPLVEYLKDNFDRGTAWHRNDERLARGLPAVSSPAMQLEGWERDLVWAETLLLTGNAESSFRHLARGWGRDKGFHRILAQGMCERLGNPERKSHSNGPVIGEYCTTIVESDTSPATVNDVWDEACYYESEYSELLASELMLDLVDEETMSEACQPVQIEPP